MVLSKQKVNLSLYLYGLVILLISGCSEYRFITQVSPVFYGFDTNEEGWRVDDGGLISYSKAGGNPGGCIYGTDNSTGAWFFLAPQSLLQEIRQGYGKTLRFDLKLNIDGTANTNDDIIITDGINTLTYDLETNPGTTWTSYSVRFDESSEWRIKGTRVSQTDIKRILQHATGCKIRGEYLEGPDYGGLDNVALQ